MYHNKGQLWILTTRNNSWQNEHICACQAVNIVFDFQKCGIKRAIEQPRSWIVDKKQKVGNKQTRLTSDRPSQINCFHMTRRKFVKTRLKMEVFRIRVLRTFVFTTHCWAPVGSKHKSFHKTLWLGSEMFACFRYLSPAQVNSTGLRQLVMLSVTATVNTSSAEWVLGSLWSVSRHNFNQKKI